MTDEIIQNLIIDNATNKLNIAHIVERMDSYHNDSRQQHAKLESMISRLPDEDKVHRLFREEGEKLAKGLIKRDDEQQSQITAIKTDISASKKAIKWIYAAVIAVGTFLGVSNWGR